MSNIDDTLKWLATLNRKPAIVIKPTKPVTAKELAKLLKASMARKPVIPTVVQCVWVTKGRLTPDAFPAKLRVKETFRLKKRGMFTPTVSATKVSDELAEIAAEISKGGKKKPTDRDVLRKVADDTLDEIHDRRKKTKAPIKKAPTPSTAQVARKASNNGARKTPLPDAQASTATPAQSILSASERQAEVMDELPAVFEERNCQVNVANQLYHALEDVLETVRWRGEKPLDIDGYHELFCPPDKPGVYLKLRRSDKPVEAIATLKSAGIVRLTNGLLPCINRFVKKAYPDLPLHPPEVYDHPDSKAAQATVKEVKLKFHQVATLQYRLTRGEVLALIEARCKALDKDELDVGDFEVLLANLSEPEPA